MDERYLRFPRWLEASGLPARISAELGPTGWPVFRRLVERDTTENFVPHWVEFDSGFVAEVCGIDAAEADRVFHGLAELGLLRVRAFGEARRSFEYRLPAPLPTPRSREEIQETLADWGLPDRPELWRYWEESEEETKYDRILRLYERTCGLKMSGRTVEDLVELAETHPLEHLEEAFEAARKEGVTALGWIRKFLKRLKKHDRIQKTWGRPRGLELPEGYSGPSASGRGERDGD